MAATSEMKKSRPAPAGMPIEGYDHLSVKSILPLLATLSGAELTAVAAHEKAGKNRVTLLRAVRQVELAREAAPRSAPASHLAIVEEAPEPVAVSEPEPAAAAVADPAPAPAPAPKARAKVKVRARTETIGGAVRPVSVRKATSSEVDTEAGIPVPDLTMPDLMMPVPAMPVPAMPVPAMPVPAIHDATMPVLTKKASAPELTKRSRPAGGAKHATWEEEPRPLLPKRIESMAYDLDPPIVAAAPSDYDLSMPSPTPPPGPRLSGPAKVARKFEGAALVMAAILAVLLGLAIGTVLARGGSTSAQPPPTVATQVASVPAGG